MDQRTVRWTALALCCLLLAACKDRHDPLKPTVGQVAAAPLTAPA